jgi:hypothetical protein
MIRPGKRTVEYNLGGSPTLNDFRQIVEETKDLPGNSKALPEAVSGQRDAVYWNLNITEVFTGSSATD